MQQGQQSKSNEQAARIIALAKTHGGIEAEQALRQLGSDTVPVAQELLQYSSPGVKNTGGQGYLPLLLLLPLWLLVIMSSDCFDGAVLLMLGVPAALIWYAATARGTDSEERLNRANVVHEVAVRVLSASEDNRAVGPLLDTTFELKYDLSAETVEFALYGLSRLLPRLRKEDGQALTVTQRESLYRLLLHHSDFVLRGVPDGPSRGTPRTSWDVPLSVGILHAYKYIGDSRALKRVTLLAQTAEEHTAEESRLIRKAAQECLPCLQEQIEALHCSKNLLRASHVPDVSPDTLLRPLTETGAVHSDQLLRVCVSEEQAREQINKANSPRG